MKTFTHTFFSYGTPTIRTTDVYQCGDVMIRGTTNANAITVDDLKFDDECIEKAKGY